MHDQFWAAHGVQVVRTGDVAKIDRDASLFLLLDPYLLVLFHSQKDFDRATRSFFDLAYVRVRDTQERQFRERVVTDEEGRFVKFERHYEGGPFSKHARVVVTRDPKLAGIASLAGTIEIPASPRATLALAACARAQAFLEGRGFVTPQDVKTIAADVLRHRMVPSYEAEAERLTSDILVARLLEHVQVP